MTIEDQYIKVSELMEGIERNINQMLDAGVREGKITPGMLDIDNYTLTKMVLHDYLETKPFAPLSKDTKSIYDKVRRN